MKGSRMTVRVRDHDSSQDSLLVQEALSTLSELLLRVADEGDSWHVVGVVKLRYGLEEV